MDAQVAVLAVAEKGSFGSAGKYLGIGKSAVRKRVQSIENELETALFRVVGKRMSPTEAGNLYILSARESVRQAFLGIDRVQAYVRVQADDLRIGYSTYLNTRLLEIVRRLQPEGIDSRFVTRESLTTQHAVAGVLQGDLHVGFGILPILDTDLSARLLFEEPLMVCLPAGHRLVAKSTIQPEDLEEEPVVAVSRKALPGRHQEIVTHFESLGVSLKFVTDTFSIKEALWLVSQGTGIALMTRSSASSHRYDVAIRPFSDRLLTVKSGVFTRSDHDYKLLRDFVDLAWAETAVLRAGSTL
jgi:DNA-binding transcriptional LysR family regulator